MFINKKILNLKRYSSGEMKVYKSNLLSFVKDNKVEILFCDNSFLELQIILDFYKTQKVETSLILPYLPYQRMDHKDKDELDSANSLANILNKLSLSKITVGEPHCEISKIKNAKKFSYIEKLKNDVFKEINFNHETDNLVLPDRGAVLKYGKLAKNVVSFEKKREPNTGLIVSHEMIGILDTTKPTLIVDDIISTGDTLVSIIEQLKNLGVKNVYIFSGHFENNKYNQRLLKNKMVKKIFSTTSLTKTEQKKLKLYNIWSVFYG